jgi:hypothetical protein
MTAPYNRMERGAIRTASRLRRWADLHYARRMVGDPDWLAIAFCAVAVLGLGLGAWVLS